MRVTWLHFLVSFPWYQIASHIIVILLAYDVNLIFQNIIVVLKGPEVKGQTFCFNHWSSLAHEELSNFRRWDN